MTDSLHPAANGNIQRIHYDVSLLTDADVHLFNEGTHYRLYEKLGAHPLKRDGVQGTYFAAWAPNASQVSLMGDFNQWNNRQFLLHPRGQSGIWEGFLPDLGVDACYKYHIVSHTGDYRVDKADPFAFRTETPPRTASVISDLNYTWHDGDWMRDRHRYNRPGGPISIYEIHLGSWMRMSEEGNRSLTYRELAPRLAEHAQNLGFTHIEILPIMEHPFYGSWGYQTTGYFAPTSRYGRPEDFMHLVDYLHQHGVGVILDWVPSHFPNDEHGLVFFDGTHLFEHADPRQGIHRDWNSYVFNYGRNEVRSFLTSSAMFWLDRYHADGLRVDAVASMLYLDYSRKPGEWIPNRYGGRENLEAVEFLRTLNTDIYAAYPDVQTYAEESTAWPMVSRPVYLGGLGFGFKWDMGWMHDTLEYMSIDPVFRKFHHNKLTFRMVYAFSESFLLALSHDEVVYGKRSLLGKMPGDDWQKFANLRLLFSCLYAQPGKKLLFMGGEFGQRSEWNHERSLEWHLLQCPAHQGVQKWLADLNQLYLREPAMHELDVGTAGFEWIDANDTQQSVLTMIRKSGSSDDLILIALNFTPLPRQNYRVGVPRDGRWQELLNSDAPTYGGASWGNFGGVQSVPLPAHGRLSSVTLTLPPLGAVFLKRQS